MKRQQKPLTYMGKFPSAAESPFLSCSLYDPHEIRWEDPIIGIILIQIIH